MMNGCGKSDEVVVAGKPVNKAGRSAAEPVERRTEAKGNAGQQRTLWTLCQDARVTDAGRMRTIATAMERLDPRWEPYAGKPHVRICAGGEEQSSSLPRPRFSRRAHASLCTPYRSLRDPWPPPSLTASRRATR